MKRALKHNTPDAAMRYHAGLIAAAAGDTTAARRRLSEALSMNPKFDIRHAPRAQMAMNEDKEAAHSCAAGAHDEVRRATAAQE